jgi:hypothetical protein
MGDVLVVKKDYCADCPHIERCREKYGAEREDGDDFRAIIGTHLCLKDWHDCKVKDKDGAITIKDLMNKCGVMSVEGLIRGCIRKV